jgi:MYXO-CTERM domain-containing protein
MLLRRLAASPAPHAAAIAAALTIVVAAEDARAFCRATTCKGTDACDGEVIDGCTPLEWRRDCIGIAIQEDGSTEIPFERARELIEGAFFIWRTADCGGAGPGIAVQNMGTVVCDRVEFNQKGGNANVVVFRDGSWPHEDGLHNLALTTVSFDPATGELYNADIEVNTAGYDFVEGGQYDLLSVLTHEVGHFFGLSHSPLEDATMYFAYTDYSTDFRTLSDDDVTAICGIYPPSDVDPQRCNPIPKHGFASECAADQGAGCSVAVAGREPAAGALAVLGAAAALAVARRRRRVTARTAP